ncbi:MAG: hypothetical protein ACTSQI_00130 [Candidatus Helarchaeota archaeon]
MEEIYKKKVRELEKETIALRKKVKFLEDKLYQKLGTYSFFTKNIESHLREYLFSSKDQLNILTRGFDVEFVNIFKKLAAKGIKIQIITSERHQLVGPEIIKAFDLCQFSAIKLYTRQTIRVNLLIKDAEQIFITSTRLVEKELADDLSFCIIVRESQVVDLFQKLFNRHLPEFLRA